MVECRGLRPAGIAYPVVYRGKEEDGETALMLLRFVEHSKLPVIGKI